MGGVGRLEGNKFTQRKVNLALEKQKVDREALQCR